MGNIRGKVLVTGAYGQLGKEVVKVFRTDYAVIATDSETLDITNRIKVKEFILKEKPDVIIHCAAWTNVDAAVRKPKAAMKVNGGGTRNICEAAKAVNASVIYISTNEVFDGKRKTPYVEENHPNPINSYAKSKLKGEEYCQKILGDRCVIIRSSWLYGPGSKNNFPNKILEKAKNRGFLQVVDDEVATPTFTLDLSKAIKQAVKKNLIGIFHIVNDGQASRYSWAKEILKIKKIKAKITPIKLRDFQRESSPPKYSVLSNIKAKNSGVELRDWRSANRDYLKLIKL